MSATPSPVLSGCPLKPEEIGSLRWRLDNLYWIVTDEGERVRFKMNEQQLALFENLWLLNLILKSRQHGFTTFICILALDCVLFNDTVSAGIIAHGLKEAQGIFRTKVKFVYDNLPDWLRAIRYPMNDSASELVLCNGSSISVGTSMRSGTLQFLHVSEFGKISRRYPDKAKEIVTGAFNTVRPGQVIFVESTAEGRDGHFFKMNQAAEKHAQMGARLTALDFKRHFVPWFKDKRNRMDPDGVPIPAKMREYFATLAEQGIELDAWQKAWYVKKAEQQGDEMKREHPSTSKEAFEAAVDGTYYSKQMLLLRTRNRIRDVKPVPSMPVNTFWDLGRNDLNAIWFHQHIAGEHRFCDFYQNSGEDLAHYVGEMQKRGYLWGRHFLPHDGENKNLERNESRVDRLVELGIAESSIVVVPRCEHLGDAIEATRRILPMCYFDEENCAEGIDCLDKYGKEWDERNGTWRDHPKKSPWSHGADAYRQFAQGWTPATGGTFNRTKNRSSRTV